MADERGRVTIVEIARECGVSKTTVGDALNPRAAHRVSKRTRELIGETAKRLGYVPNHSARAMRTKRTNIIGVMLPNPNNSFHGRIVLELQKRLSARGYTAFFVFWDDYDAVGSVNRALSTLLTHGVEGIISAVLPGVHFRSSHVPIVFWQSAPAGFDLVGNFEGARTGYQRLVEILRRKGCARFAVLAPVLDQGRAPIIIDVLRRAGLEPAEGDVAVANSRGTARDVMRGWLAESDALPDVVLCNNDAIAISAMNEAIKSGVKVPEQMKFVGFDGTDEAEFSNPSLTTFRVSVEDAADKLLELLFARMSDGKTPAREIMIDPVLEIRGSI